MSTSDEPDGPERDSRTGLRIREWLVGGLVAGIAVATLFIIALTQTDPGRERVLALALDATSGGLNGELVVERLDGNLLTGAKLYAIRLAGEDGEPLLLADSALVNYRLPTLIRGDVFLERLVLYDPELYLRRLPGDTLWNYERIFLSGEDEQPGEPGRAFLFEEMRVIDGRVVLRTAWEPGEELVGAEREQSIAEALADTSRLRVERVPGGLLRTIRIGLDDARLSSSVYAPAERGGSLFHFDRLSGTLRLWREPFEVEYLEGELAFEEGRIEFRVPRGILPESRFSAFGVIELADEEAGEEANRYDISVVGEQLAFADLQALYPRLPQDGHARLRFTMETRPEGTLFLVRQLRLEAPGTRIIGDFGMVAGDTIRFVNTDLEAPTLRVPTIEAMLPAELPIEGLRIGEAEIGS